MTGTSDVDDTDWKAEADTLIAARGKVRIWERTTRRVKPWDILHATCELHRVTISDMCGNGKTRPLIDARATYVGVARQATDASFPEIAKAMGRLSHSTAMRAYAAWMRRDGNDQERDIEVTHRIARRRKWMVA